LATKIENTSYDIQNKWISDIAPKYFDINDISMLRSGLFGYVNEISSNSMEDSINMMNIISNEIYPNKAVLPNSIYSYAALGDFSDFNAKPSSINFTLALRLSDLLTYSTSSDNSEYFSFTISRYSTLIINSEKQFMLDYDVKIKIREKINTDKSNEDSGYFVSAYYNIDDLSNAMSSITNPYILTKQMLLTENNSLGEWYVFLYLSGAQVERESFEYTVYTNDLVESIRYDIEYSGTLSDFNVWYTPATSSTPIQLEKIYVDSVKPESDYFCFYQYSGTNSITITFSAHPDYFKPEFNSTIMVEVYTTLGEDGNFVYEGDDVDFAFYIDETQDQSMKVIHFCHLSGAATGGADALSIEEIKYNTIKAFSVRNNIISDNDLDYYFNGITKNCKMKFVKKRDDLIQRIYSAFLLLKNSDDEILPTNTINLHLDMEDFDNYETDSSILAFKPGKLLAYKEEINDWIYYDVDKEHDIDYVIENESVSNYYYTNPFLMKVNTNPYFVSYYLNSVFDTYNLIFSYIDEDSLDEFIISSFNIERNAIISDTYKITFNINTSLNYSEFCDVDANNNYIFNDNLMVKIFLRTSSDDNYLGYVNCRKTGISNDGLFINMEAELYTEDLITSDDEIVILNSIYKLGSNLAILRRECSVPSDDVYLEIGIFYNGYNSSNKGKFTNLLPNYLNDYCLCNLFESSTEIKFFKDINNIEYSTLILDNNEATAFKIKSIPVVRYLYLYNEDSMENFITLIDYFRSSLQSTLSIIENNFDLDLKFYNTYGKSQYFTIGRNGEALSGTAVSINLVIKLNIELTELVKSDIQSYIISFVESINNTDDTNYLYISNLIQGLTNTFSYITYIEFKDFNGTGDSSKQIIENNIANLSNMNNKQVIKYVPEYLNVSKKSSYDEKGNLTFTPEIYIEYI
jgi:hypothetical protein